MDAPLPRAWTRDVWQGTATEGDGAHAPTYAQAWTR